MPRMKVKDIKREVNKEEDEFYGEETETGSSPKPSSDDDVEKDLENVIGPDAKDILNKRKPFDIDEELDKDDDAGNDEEEDNDSDE